MENLGVLLIFIGCLLPVVTNTFNGARGVDEKPMWSAENLGASRLGLFAIRFNVALQMSLRIQRHKLSLARSPWLAQTGLRS